MGDEATGELPPANIPGQPYTWDLVRADLDELFHAGEIDTDSYLSAWSMGDERDGFGLKKYRTRLQPNNQREAPRDHAEELADAVVYARNMVAELDGSVPADLRIAIVEHYYATIGHWLRALTLRRALREARGEAAAPPAAA